MDTFYANLARQLRYMNRFHLFSFHNVLGGCFFFLLKRCYLVVLSQENIEALILMVIFSTAMRQIQ